MHKSKYDIDESALRFGQGLVVAVCLSIAIGVLSVAMFGAFMEAIRAMP